MGTWEDITNACNFGYYQGTVGFAYKNNSLRMVVFSIVVPDNVRNQSVVATIGQLPGNLPKYTVLGTASHATAGVSVDMNTSSGANIRSSHSINTYIEAPKYFGVLLY